jgi:hypothetical protein
VKKGDKYMVPRTLGSNESIKKIENELRLLTKMPEENEMTI